MPDFPGLVSSVSSVSSFRERIIKGAPQPWVETDKDCTTRFGLETGHAGHTGHKWNSTRHNFCVRF